MISYGKSPNMREAEKISPSPLTPAAPPRKPSSRGAWLVLYLILPLAVQSTDSALSVTFGDLPGFFLLGYSIMHLIVGVHEVGHLVAGKFAGFLVQAFRVGSGPTIFQFKHHQCEYTWCLVPTEGFVKGAPTERSLGLGSQTAFHLGGIAGELLCAAVVWLIVHFGPTWTAVWHLPYGRYAILTAGIYFVVTVVGSSQPAKGRVGGESSPNDALQVIQLWSERGALEEKRQILRDTQGLNEFVLGGDPIEVEARLRSLIERHPDNLHLKIISFQQQIKRGDLDGAKAEIESLLRTKEDRYENRAKLLDLLVTATLDYGRNDWLPAADNWSYEVLLAFPDSITLRGSRGSILAELGRNAEARDLLCDVLTYTANPVDKAYSQIYLAWLDAQEGKTMSALGRVKKAKSFGVEIRAIPRLEQKIRDLVPSS